MKKKRVKRAVKKPAKTVKKIAKKKAAKKAKVRATSITPEMRAAQLAPLTAFKGGRVIFTENIHSPKSKWFGDGRIIVKRSLMPKKFLARMDNANRYQNNPLLPEAGARQTKRMAERAIEPLKFVGYRQHDLLGKQSLQYWHLAYFITASGKRVSFQKDGGKPVEFVKGAKQVTVSAEYLAWITHDLGVSWDEARTGFDKQDIGPCPVVLFIDGEMVAAIQRVCTSDPMALDYVTGQPINISKVTEKEAA